MLFGYELTHVDSRIQIEGDLETTSRFIDGLRIPYIAPSLGGVESLVEQPTIISYWYFLLTLRLKLLLFSYKVC